MIAVTVLAGLLLSLAGLALWVRHKFPQSDDELVTAIDNLLPQTQCAQCGFPGCLPYAEALANAEVAPNLCPPGGESLVADLVELLHIEETITRPVTPPDQVAIIDESACIGCALCLPPCPVDAIVGANGFMHTVVAEECTGCELCIPACPVDCISLEALSESKPESKGEIPATSPAQQQGCIRCGQCDDACPIDLPAQALLHSVTNHTTTESSLLGIDKCIECGLCDRACPSGIPLAEIFTQERKRRAAQDADRLAKETLKIRFDRHEQRLREQANQQQDQRAARLNRPRTWQ